MAFYQTDNPLNPDIFIFRMLTNKTTLTTSHLHDISNEKFFTSSPSHALTHFPHFLLVTESQWLLFKPPHWSPGHMAHYNLPLANYHSRNLYKPCMPLWNQDHSLSHLNLAWFCWKIFYTNLLHCICLLTTCIHSYFVCFIFNIKQF